MRQLIFLVSGCLCFISLACSSGKSGEPDGGWQATTFHVDQPYVQEQGRVVGQLSDVRALVQCSSDSLYAGTAAGVYSLVGDSWQAEVLPLSGAVLDLACAGGVTLAVVFDSGVVIGGVVAELSQTGTPLFIAPRGAGGFWIAGDGMAGYWDDSYTSIYDQVGQAVRAVVDMPDGSWAAATAGGVMGPSGPLVDGAGLSSVDVRGLVVRGDGTLWVATDQDLASLAPGGSSFVPFTGADGLHYADFMRLVLGPDDQLLAATPMGASVYRPDGTRRYYLGRHWLPDNEVRDVLMTLDQVLWFATAAGVSRVDPVPMTLQDRADLYDDVVQARHVRLGYTTTQNVLDVPGDLSSFRNIDDDNDGQWTAQYLASQCFRYAVTGEEEARQNARQAAYAMMKLQEVAGSDGFFARSIVPPEECPAKQEPGMGEWHMSDDGLWCWKGDTSSDEFVGHMFGLSLFHDLVADEDERADVAYTLGRILGTMIDNGYMLLDIDGEVTSHGHFDPHYMENDISALFGDAGLNSAMMLGGLRAAYLSTGEQRFQDAFLSLAHDHNYKENVSLIEEINLSWHTNHDSEEMSFLAMFTLIRLEDDPELLALWLQGLDYLWQVQRPERNPEFNVMYAALAQANEWDLAQTIETLQKMPLDLVIWGQQASHRLDKDEDPLLDRHGVTQNLFVFPWDERENQRWAENPYRLDQPGNGRQESSALFWLLPYWMARYYGLIQ